MLCIYFSVSFQRTSSSSFFSLSSPAGRSSANINVRTQSPFNLGSGVQNGNVPAPPTVPTKRAEELTGDTAMSIYLFRSAR